MAGPKAGRRLLAWYDAHARLLPWRRDRDPYRVWVSEVMLQQTRVDTVVPYYERFLSRFPDVETLAQAELDEVLGLWSGLGYYRRARQMHAAARQIAANRGRFPTRADELSQLPGVGPYTAAAVASIAFGEIRAVLDGNVVRVLGRYLAEGGDPRRAAVRRILLTAAEAMLDPERPGDTNQALMELGATVCTPRAPRCADCPLLAGCAAAAAGEAESYPRAADRRSPVREQRLAAVVERRGRILLFRRGEESRLLAGIWEVPWAPSDDGSPEAALARRYGGCWRLDGRRGRVRHAVTFRSLEVEVWDAAHCAAPGVAEGREAGWFAPPELDGLPISSLVRKILATRLDAPNLRPAR